MRTICHSPIQMREAELWLKECDLIANDIETIPHVTKAKKPQPFVMTVASYTGLRKGEFQSFAYQLTQQKSALVGEHRYAQEGLESIGRNNALPIRQTLHNGVYDCAWYLRYGVPIANYAYDSMTLWWSRYPDLPKTLSFVSSILLDDYSYWKDGRKDEDFTGHSMYAMADTENTLRNTIRLIEWANADPAMTENFHAAHMRCLTGLAMSVKGMLVDWSMREEMGIELEKKAKEALDNLRFILADDNFNPNSAPAKKELFYGLLGAQPRNAKGRILKRVGGNAKPSVGAIVLRGLKSEHPILRRIVTKLQDAQEPAKQISNVMGIEYDGTKETKARFRTGYDGIGTTTSRLSSRKDAFNFGGNGQNIRKKYRRILKADPNSLILEVDFSAADDVYVSYESEEPKKIAVIERGLDTHSFNAAEVFFPHWTYEGVVSGKKADDPAVTHPITGIRQITKKTTHGANYLMAGHTLLNSAGREAIVGAAKHSGHADAGLWGIDRLVEYCEWMDGRYRAYYPRFARSGAHSFYADLSLMLRRTRSFTSIFHYTQRFLADPMEDSTLRALAATVGQANTAGRVNMAMLELDQGYRTLRFRDGDAPDFDEPALQVTEKEHGASLRLQTHDSLTFNIQYTHPNWFEGVTRIFHVLQRPVVCRGRIIRLGIEADCSINWAHKSEVVKNPDDVRSWIDKLAA